ncbi:MAG: hypothetical protein ACOY7J_21065, partial [Pseudomonadota bacterium]
WGRERHMNHILRLTLLTLVWMSSAVATATVITAPDHVRGYPEFKVPTFEVIKLEVIKLEVIKLEVIKLEVMNTRPVLGFNLDQLDQYQPPLKKNVLTRFLNRWRFVQLPVWPHPPVGKPPVPGTKPPVAVAEPAVLELMALGFGVLMLLRIRLSRINDAGQNPAS